MKFKGIPTFRILDLEKAKEFYIRFLGFKIDWEHRFEPSAPVYMQVSKENLVLHLTENERFQTGTVVFVETDSIEKFHAELMEDDKDSIVPPISITPWNTKQLELSDPFGNMLRFNENLKSS